MVSFKSFSNSNMNSRSFIKLLIRKFWGNGLALIILMLAIIIALFLAYQKGWFSKVQVQTEGYDTGNNGNGNENGNSISSPSRANPNPTTTYATYSK